MGCLQSCHGREDQDLEFRAALKEHKAASRETEPGIAAYKKARTWLSRARAGVGTQSKPLAAGPIA